MFRKIPPPRPKTKSHEIVEYVMACRKAGKLLICIPVELAPIVRRDLKPY